MHQDKVNKENPVATWMLVLSIMVFAFWFTSRKIDVYQVPIIGVLFELLWLPFIVLTVILPFLCLYYWRKAHFKVSSGNLIAMVIVMISILLMLTDT